MQQSRRPWTREEDDAVIQIVDEVGLKNWPLVSTLMKQKYNVVGRSGKQCRQRWHNQLNPQVNKKPWSEQQQKLLFQAHKRYRNRWIDISKLFQGRTDNSIKNHFYSTIRRSLRRICKLLGNKNSTSELRNIKPSILSKIFEYSELKGDQVTQENQYIVNQSKIITEELLNFARSKPTKSGDILEEVKRKNLQALIDKLNEFSKNYKNQKDGYRQNLGAKLLSPKIPKVIIVKSQQNKQKQQEQIDNGNRKEFGMNLKERKKAKQFSYDWQQFEKRCLYVKQVFQNKTQCNRGSPSNSKEQEMDSEIYSLNNQFSLQEKSQSSDKAETYTTPRVNSKRKGFQPYRQMNSAIGVDDYQGIIEKIKYQMTTY